MPKLSAWGHRLKAESLEKAGFMAAAMPELERAVRLGPRDARLRAALGARLASMKQYRRAAAQYAEAIRLEPGRAEHRRQAARALWLAGRPRQAARELERCVELEPGSSEYRLEALWMRVRAGGAAGAPLKRLAQERDPALRAGAHFLAGLAHLRRGRWRRAAKELERVSGAPMEGCQPEGYARMARSFSVLRREVAMEDKKKGVLLVTGLGLDSPWQATLEVLQRLHECDVVFNNTHGVASARLLDALCEDVRPIAYHTDGEEGPWVRALFREIRPGRVVGFVTQGHPLVSGTLADALLKRARREGVTARCYAAVSTVDQMLALSQEVFQETVWGLQVYDVRPLVEGRVTPNPAVPLLLYLDAGRTDAPRLDRRAREVVDGLCALLRRLYPASQAVLWLGARYDARLARPLSLGALRERLLRVPPVKLGSVVLYIPPARDGVNL